MATRLMTKWQSPVRAGMLFPNSVLIGPEGHEVSYAIGAEDRDSASN